MPGYLDKAARALEAVEMSAGSYGRKELGEKARGVEGEDGGTVKVISTAASYQQSSWCSMFEGHDMLPLVGRHHQVH